MLITRNHLPTSGPIDRDDLDALGDIQIAFEQEDYDAIVGQVNDALGQGVAGQNYLRNADWSLWSRGQGPLSLSEGIWTELSDYWLARADYGAFGSGGSGTFASYALAPDTQHEQWLYCAKLSGALNLSSLDIGQRVPARVTAALHPKCTLTLEIENESGAAITPVIRYETCDAFENYNSTTLRVSAALTPIAAGATAVSTTTLDLTSFAAQVRNGAMIYVRFAGLTDVGKFVKVYAAKLEVGTTGTPRVTERNTDGASGGSGGGGVTAEQINYFANPNFHRWQATATTCQEAVRTWGPLGWFARPAAGNTLTLSRDTVTPDVGSRFAALMTGDAAVTAFVDFGSQLDLPTASEAQRALVFSCKLYNATGAAIVPTLLVDTCTSENSFNTTVNRITQTLAPCADSAWTDLVMTFDAAALTNFANGAELYLRFDSGTLSNVSQGIRIARPRLEPGSAPTSFVPKPAYDEPQVSGGSYATLRTYAVDSTHIGMTATEIVLKDGGGKVSLIPAFTAAIDITTSGAGGLDYATPAAASTWHYIWALSKGDGLSAILSQSATAPNLPDSYLYCALIGAIYIGSGSILSKFLQVGKDVWIGKTNAFLSTATADDTWQTLSLAAIVAPNAVECWGVAGVTTANNGRFRISGDAPATFTDPGIGEVDLLVTDTGASNYGFRASGPWRVPIVTAQTVYWAVANHTAAYRIDIGGYTLA